MSEWKNIIIHCSDSEFGCARVIRHWHSDPKPRGRGWRDIGYHFVIQNGFPVKDFYLSALDGGVECGRALDGDDTVDADEVGAHTLGMNKFSIGICMVGKYEKYFTTKQFQALMDLLIDLMKRFDIGVDDILGHYETSQAGGKTCPNFDVRGFREILKREQYIRRDR